MTGMALADGLPAPFFLVYARPMFLKNTSAAPVLIVCDGERKKPQPGEVVEVSSLDAHRDLRGWVALGALSVVAGPLDADPPAPESDPSDLPG